jgi:hypothetical protein
MITICACPPGAIWLAEEHKTGAPACSVDRVRAVERDRREVGGQPPQLAPLGEPGLDRLVLRVRAEQGPIDRGVVVHEREVGSGCPKYGATSMTTASSPVATKLFCSGA